MNRWLLVVPFALVACGSPAFESLPLAPARELEEPLLPAAGDLQGRTVRHAGDGAWVVRIADGEHRRVAERRARARAAGAPPPPPSSPHFPATGPRASGPSTPGPAGPSTAGPSGPETRTIAAHDDFYFGDGGGTSYEVVPAAPRRTRRPAGAAPLVPMRAGTTDDNADLPAYLAFLARAKVEPGLRGRWVPIDVEGRCTVQVVDAAGQPMPGVELRFVDQGSDRVVWRGTTYGDGRAPLYPRLVRGEGAPPWLVEVLVGERMVRAMTFGDRDLVVRVPGRAQRAAAVPIDVAFVLDTTGSMRDEIAAIQATLLDVTLRLRGLGRDVDLRYGAVLYRDVGDAYVTRHHPLTADLEAFDRVLGTVEAGGGGDGPESLNQALAVAVGELRWRAGAARVAFVVGDAPPHVDYEGDVPYDRSLRAAVARGIRIHTVAASGLRDEGTVVFRQIAQFTRGEFVFVEYGGDVQASARAHGVAGEVTGNDLGEILFARIRNEALRWGRSVATAAVAAR